MSNIEEVEEGEMLFDVNWIEYSREHFDDEIEDKPFDDFIEGDKKDIAEFLKKIS